MSSENASALNLATVNKWIAILPIQQINSNYNSQNMAFNLASYNLPEMTLGTEDTSYFGTTIAIPNHVRQQDKTVTFEYMLSSDWRQWKFLYSWAGLIAKEIGSGTDIDRLGNVMLPIRVMILSEFKNPIFEIVYHDCYITNFGAVSMDYQDPDDANIKHDFTVTYTYFEFIDLLES